MAVRSDVFHARLKDLLDDLIQSRAESGPLGPSVISQLCIEAIQIISGLMPAVDGTRKTLVHMARVSRRGQYEQTCAAHWNASEDEIFSHTFILDDDIGGGSILTSIFLVTV